MNGMHCGVRGDKLLYDHVTHWCGMGSGHARLAYTLLTSANNCSLKDSTVNNNIVLALYE